MKTYGTRTCLFCGKEFIATSPRQQVCKSDHYAPCPDCGMPVKIVDPSYAVFIKHGPKRCKACARKHASMTVRNKSTEDKLNILEKRKTTNKERYGVEFASQSDAAKNKSKQTMLQRYGVEHALQSKEILHKMEEGNIAKYGVKSVMHAPEIKAKHAESMAAIHDTCHLSYLSTMIDKYGVPNPMQHPDLKARQQASVLQNHGVKYPMQSEEIKAKSKATVESKYGVSYISQIPEVIAKREATSLERYGVTNPTQSDEIKLKIQQTCIQRYGVRHYPESTQFLLSRISNPIQLHEYLKFKDDPIKYIQQKFEYKPSISELRSVLGVTDTPVYEVLSKFNCQDIIEHKYSSMEVEVSKFLLSIDPDIVLVHNDRDVIKPQELDIWLPEYNLGIECNPTVTHNSSIPDPWSTTPLHYKYHQNKSIQAENAGVFLFHIFEYEWINRPQVIKSMLRNLIHKSLSKFGARDTYVSEVSNSECKSFLNANHRQGELTAKIRLGLRVKSTDELVAVMTFNRIRSTMGKSSSSNAVWELSRFCNRLNTNVAGGASKLFTYFVRHYEGGIVSFSDRAHTQGNLYSQLGFTRVSETTPSYVWVNLQTGQYYHRVQCQKRNLRKLFNDESIDIENKTEKQIMEEHGYVQVFDSGVIRWEYN